MRITTKTNVDEVLRDLDAFVADVTQVAMPRALNKLAEQAQTVGLRAVAQEYGLPVGQFRKYLRMKRAREGADFEASITAKGSGLPLYLFAPRQVRGGVSVKVKGRRFIVPHAFIARMRSGRVGVFARGAYGGKAVPGAGPTGQRFGRFVFHRGVHKVRADRVRTALPINELYTFGPAEAWSAESVTQAMADRVEQQAAKVIAQEVRFAARGRR
jgi:hypothetical protein